jgi:hypothetical protein
MATKERSNNPRTGQRKPGAVPTESRRDSPRQARSAPPGRDEERRAQIALAAYYRAERRGFGSDGEVDDWLQAEQEVDRAATLHSAMMPPHDSERDREVIETDRLAAWARKLKVSTPRLREAIEKVGPSVSVVKQYLENSTPSSAA